MEILESKHYENSESVCRIIILIDSLIKLRESVDLSKKFYHRVLIKNIKYVYGLYTIKPNEPPNEIRIKIYNIFNETFHNKNFKPKKMEDCLGYFLMISR